jgi:site-specific recombinase XerD
MTRDDRFFRLVRDFLLIYLPKNRCDSPHTVKSYREALQLLRTYLKDERGLEWTQITFDCLDHQTVGAFLAWLEGTRRCSVATRNQRLAALKSFAKYAAQEDVSLTWAYTELSKVPAKKTPRAAIVYLSEKALASLLAQPDPKTPRGLRNNFLLILLYDTGARIQELLDLRLRDLHLQDPVPCVYLHGKGGKTRVIPLLPKTVQHLHRYLQHFHRSHNNGDAWLFYTRMKGRMGPLSPDAVAQFLNRYGTRAREQCPDVPLRVYPHLFRHTRAMHLYQAGMPLSYIKDFLGHASVDTTDIYAATDITMLKTALEKIRSDLDSPVDPPVWEDNEELLRQLCGLQ